MRESLTSGRSTIIVIIILLISMQFAVLTLDVDEEASSSARDDFSFGDICGATGGACDQLNPSTDGTPAAKEWIEGDYTFEMISTSQIGLTMEWAMHEFNDSKVGGLNALFPSLPSAAADQFTQNGLPADEPEFPWRQVKPPPEEILDAPLSPKDEWASNHSSAALGYLIPASLKTAFHSRLLWGW